MNKFLVVTTLFSVFLGVQTQAAPSVGDLEVVLDVYQRQAMVESSVVKTVTSEMLGKKTEYPGRVWMSKEKFRWETDSPEKSLLVFDGSSIISVQYPNKDLGGKLQVARGKVDTKSNGHILISLIMKKESLSTNFEVIKIDSAGSIKTIQLKSKRPELGVTSLVITVDSTKKKITELNYSDDIGNKTQLVFGPVYFNKTKASNNFFKFSVPKGAQVTEL